MKTCKYCRLGVRNSRGVICGEPDCKRRYNADKMREWRERKSQGGSKMFDCKIVTDRPELERLLGEEFTPVSISQDGVRVALLMVPGEQLEIAQALVHQLNGVKLAKDALQAVKDWQDMKEGFPTWQSTEVLVAQAMAELNAQ